MKKDHMKNVYSRDPDDEWNRLAKDAFHRLEFDTTMHFLKKHLPTNGLILDAGGGPGRYTISLAELGYDVILLDLTPALLELARKRIKEYGVESRVKDIVEGSIADLSVYPDNHFDAVVCLGGPISHIDEGKNRKKAMAELHRVTKKSGVIGVSVMGRLSVLTECLRYWPQEIKAKKNFVSTYKHGDDYSWKKDGYCHFFLPEDFENLVSKAGIKITEKIGLEGLASPAEEEINKLSKDKDAIKTWLDSHYELCTHPAVFGTSGHMLIIGKKI